MSNNRHPYIFSFILLLFDIKRPFHSADQTLMLFIALLSVLQKGKWVEKKKRARRGKMVRVNKNQMHMSTISKKQTPNVFKYSQFTLK